jgi:hypothetical protein
MPIHSFSCSRKDLHRDSDPASNADEIAGLTLVDHLATREYGQLFVPIEHVVDRSCRITVHELVEHGAKSILEIGRCSGVHLTEQIIERGLRAPRPAAAPSLDRFGVGAQIVDRARTRGSPEKTEPDRPEVELGNGQTLLQTLGLFPQSSPCSSLAPLSSNHFY